MKPLVRLSKPVGASLKKSACVSAAVSSTGIRPECWKRLVARSSAVELIPSNSSGDAVAASHANLLSACITILPVVRWAKESRLARCASFFVLVVSPVALSKQRSDLRGCERGCTHPSRRAMGRSVTILRR
jgi:hypothetical protein